MRLTTGIRGSKKGLINIKNNDQKRFSWCHVRYINPVKIHPEIITRKDKKPANYLDYGGVKFSVQEKDFNKIGTKNNICINVYCYENKFIFPIYVSDQKCRGLMVFLLVTKENKSHYGYANNFDRFMFHKTKNKNKKYFGKSCLQCFSGKHVLTEHKKVSLSINGAKRLEIGKRNNQV